MRVEAAKSLLIETDQPMTMISDACGFGDAERLSVVFRRHTGTSPSKFRKASLTGERFKPPR
jgi:transcriptional regulator GlxA family with amidase domain